MNVSHRYGTPNFRRNCKGFFNDRSFNTADQRLTRDETGEEILNNSGKAFFLTHNANIMNNEVLLSRHCKTSRAVKPIIHKQSVQSYLGLPISENL